MSPTEIKFCRNQYEQIFVYDASNIDSTSLITIEESLTTDFGTTNDLISDIEYSPDSTMVAVTVGREDNSDSNDGGLVILTQPIGVKLEDLIHLPRMIIMILLNGVLMVVF